MEFINFELSDNELNGLFNYNIDLLKSTLSNLLKNQKINNHRIFDLEYKIQSNNIGNTNTTNLANDTEGKNIDLVNNGKDFDNFRKTNASSSIEKRLEFLEMKFFNVIPNIEEEVEKIKQFNNKKNYLNEKAQIISPQEDYKSIIEELKAQIDEINLKLADFNIFEAFNKKNVTTNSAVGKEGVNEEVYSHLQSLEQKTSKKFINFEEKFIKLEEETVKLKNEHSINKMHSEYANRSLIQNKNNIDNLLLTVDELRKMFNIQSDLIDKLNQQPLLNEEYLNNKINEQLNSGGITNNNYKQIDIISKAESSDRKEKPPLRLNLSEFANRLENLESLLKANNISGINDSIKKIMDVIHLKSNLSDTFELKDLTKNHSSQINFLLETLTQLQEDTKVSDEITYLKRKVDSISNSLGDIKISDEIQRNKSPVRNLIQPNYDMSNYLEQSVFNDFKRYMIKELEICSGKLQESKKITEEIINLLSTKVTEKDLKFLEEYLLNRLDEMKLASTRKFADKNETTKNMKYLDNHIKHIVDVYIKKVDRTSENWLIAKKPIDGFKCGSCEAYIGEIQDRNTNVNWNKNPINQKDSNYNTGNGFSRMLNIINLDNALNKNKPYQVQTSSDFYKTGYEPEVPQILNHKQSLPFLPKMNILSDNNSDIQIKQDEIKSELINDPYQPKVTKIYKKAKNNDK